MKELTQPSNFKKEIDAILKRTDLKSNRISDILGIKNSSYRSASYHGKIRRSQYDKIVEYFKIYDEAMLQVEIKLKEITLK